MIRRFNYTGRRRIPESRIRIRIVEDGSGRHFDADLDLSGLRLPRDACVYVEAWHRYVVRRWDFGTVGARRVPADRSLDGFPVATPLFRVKVVLKEGEVARILAAAHRVVPRQGEREDESRRSLLPVDFEDLGERVWALDLDADWPRLVLNRRLDGIREAARSDPAFLALVYPEILRAILSRALAEGANDPDCNDDDWGTCWVRYACRELGRPRPPEDHGHAAETWIEETVDAFCARCRVRPAFEQVITGHAR